MRRFLRRLTTLPAGFNNSLAFVLAVTAGVVVELIQPALGREAELIDLRTDALGAAAGLSFVALVSPRRHWLDALVFVLAAGAALWPVAEASLAYWERFRQFPTVMDFTSRSDWYFLDAKNVELAATRLPQRWIGKRDLPSLQLRITGQRWPGVTHIEPQPDWRGYSRLMVDLTNPDTRPLGLTLRVHDRAHRNDATDRFNVSFTLAPATRTVLAFPLAEIAAAPRGRELDLANIAGLIVFTDGGPELLGREFYVTRLWLE
jgi:hypothetical protein